MDVNSVCQKVNCLKPTPSSSSRNVQTSDHLGRVLQQFSSKLLLELNSTVDRREENMIILSCADLLTHEEAGLHTQSDTSRVQSGSHKKADFEHYERPTKKNPEHYESRVDRLLNTYQKATSQEGPDRDAPFQSASSRHRDSRSPDQPLATLTTRKPAIPQSKPRDLEAEVDFESVAPLTSK